jgi:hypothetical protein
VLLVDTVPQAYLTVSLGNPCPDDLAPTLSDLMGKIMMESPIAPGEGILHHPEGVDLVPSNIELSGMEVALVNAISRETILRQYLDTVKKNYVYYYGLYAFFGFADRQSWRCRQCADTGSGSIPSAKGWNSCLETSTRSRGKSTEMR